MLAHTHVDHVENDGRVEEVADEEHFDDGARLLGRVCKFDLLNQQEGDHRHHSIDHDDHESDNDPHNIRQVLLPLKLNARFFHTLF